jgi:talin
VVVVKEGPPSEETGSMCEAANDLVKGEASEEKLEAAAQGVSTATGQLLIACKVKAEPDSEAMKRLDQAGAGVRRAADNLVKASTAARENKMEEPSNLTNKSDFQVKREELKARERLLKAKRELEAAEAQLRHTNEERYRRQTAEEEEQANQE